MLLSPIKGCDKLPMILIMRNGISYVGSLLNGFVNRGLMVKYPILYSEVINNSREMMFSFNKIYNGISMIEELTIKYDTFMYLKSDDSSHIKMSKLYEETVQQFLSRDSNIIVPTLDQVKDLNRIN